MTAAVNLSKYRTANQIDIVENALYVQENNAKGFTENLSTSVVRTSAFNKDYADREALLALICKSII